MGWWERTIIEPGRLPILLCLAAFIVTFLVTRTITRMIRAGVGPFRNNVTASGVHIHHSVYGIILLIAGAIGSVAVAGESPWREIAAVVIGIGMSLVLDEFAMILHLDDVYWSDEGRTSVMMVSLAAACLGFVVIGAVPFGVSDISSTEAALRIGAIVSAGLGFATLTVCVLKGKLKTAVLGIFVPFISTYGAIRLAQPDSRWARRHYDDAKMARARARATTIDDRWDPIGDWLSNFIAGKPSEPDPAPAAGSPPSSPAA